MVISSLPVLPNNRPTTAIKLNANKMCIIFKSVLVVWSLLSKVIPYRQETLILDAEQMTILSRSNGLVLGEMSCHRPQTIMIFRDMQSHIRNKSITNDWYIGAQSTKWTCMNQPLFRPQLPGLGQLGLTCVLSGAGCSLFNIWQNSTVAEYCIFGSNKG
jgi:hypothetical protein